MDIQMPVLDGLEATRRIRAQPSGASIPVVALTANVFAAEQQEYREAGMTDFLAKPVGPEALYALLGRYLPMDESPARQPATAPPATASTTLSKTELLHQVAVLAKLLQNGDSRAPAYFYAIKAEFCREFPRDCEPLQRQIEQFNFEAAWSNVNQLTVPADTALGSTA